MKSKITNLGVVLLGFSVILIAVSVDAAARKHKPPKGQASVAQSGTFLEREVGHQLRLLPYYSVFDNLAYRVNGYNVELMGEVTRPTLKSDAENVVKRIEGVESVTNNIKVLPLSSMDDQIRLAEYRAIYGDPALSRYGMQAVPSIHIIADNGHVTLVGVVDNEGDKNIAGIRANGVSGVFSVTNNLVVQK